MTISSETNKVSHNGDDSTVTFAVPFYFLLDSSIEVTHVAADGTETTWALTTDYTVTDAGEEAGGSITAVTAPATDTRLVIIRNEALTQTTDYIENDDFPAASHERALDKAMMINQQQQEEISRCISAPVGDDGTTDFTFPTYSASTFLQWHPTLAELRNAALAGVGSATIGTDSGDLVELVTVGAGVGFPALYLDNLTLAGTALGDVITKDHGTATGEVPLNSDLGTAAVVDTGTAASEIPLNSDIIDIVNLYKCIISVDTDTEHDINFGMGFSTLTTGAAYKTFTFTEKTKQINVDWAEGDDDGGFPSGLTLTASTLYYCFQIGKADGTVDAGFDTAKTATNLLTDASDYIYYRLRGSFKTDASLNIDSVTIGDAKDTEDWAGAILNIEDQKAQNTAGGGFTQGALRTRDLNTILINQVPGASLSSNQVTLPAGMFRVKFKAPAYRINYHQAVLYNISDSTVDIIGNNGYVNTATAATTYSEGESIIDISASKIFEVQHESAATQADNGFGIACNFRTEVYTQLIIEVVKLY